MYHTKNTTPSVSVFKFLAFNGFCGFNVVFIVTASGVIGPGGWSGFLWDRMGVCNVICGVWWEVSSGLRRTVCEAPKEPLDIARIFPIC